MYKSMKTGMRGRYFALANCSIDYRKVPVHFDLLKEFENRKIVSASVIEIIINSEKERQEFKKCLLLKRKYKNCNPQEILVALNFLKMSRGIGEDFGGAIACKIIDELLELSDISKCKKVLQRVKVDGKTHYVSVKILIRIIKNVNGYYEKFKDFEENKEYFLGIDYEIWKKALEVFYKKRSHKNVFSKGDFNRVLCLVAPEEVSETFYENVHVPSGNYEVSLELKEKVLANIPESFTGLEKAILIYYRLCLYLSFDPYYLAYEDDEKHILKYLTRYDDPVYPYSEIICIDFMKNFIALLLEEGLPVKLAGSRISDTVHHQFALLNWNGVDIEFDSTEGVYRSDIVKLKFSERYPKGIRPSRKLDDDLSSKIKQEIAESISNVMDYLENNEKVYWDSFENLEVYLDESSSLLSVDQRIELIDKFISQANNASAFDKCICIRDLCYSAFDSHECNFLQIAYTYSDVAEHEVVPGIIIDYIDYKNPESPRYTYYYSGEGIKRVSIDELSELFQCGELKYLNDDYKIDGIVEKRTSPVLGHFMI